jgi:hypothetical protein
MAESKLYAVAGMIVMVLATLAAADAPPDLSLETRRVVIFKDGYCMFAKRATGKVNEGGKARIQQVPDAMTLGSFWTMPEKGKLKSVVARQQINVKKGRQETDKCLELEFEPGAANREVAVNLFYLGPGIRWIPTYRIALDKADRADMAMQAEILNEAEDLAEVEAELVVGVPNFRFKNVVSPFSLVQALVNPLQQAAPQLMGQDMSNVLFTQRAGEFRGRPGAEAQPGPGAPALPPELVGEGAQDLFVYHIAKLTLRAGERAALPVISAQVPFRHLYTWDVSLSRSGAESLPGVGAHVSPLKLLKNDVWHQIELTNNTAVPWTTGAALVMQSYLPIAQELLTYTSVGGRCQVPLTVAVDVRGTYSEKETGREPAAIKFTGYEWMRIGKKGTLQVTNYKKEAIDLLITCQLGGNATGASDDGKITVSDYESGDWSNLQAHPALNGHSTILWEMKLKPGETKEATCDYTYYIR